MVRLGAALLLVLGLRTGAQTKAQWDALRTYSAGTNEADVSSLTRALEALPDSGDARAAATDLLVTLGQDAALHPDALRIVCMQLGRIGDERVVPMLAGLLGHANVGVADAACAALVQLDSDPARHALRRALATLPEQSLTRLALACGTLRDGAAVDSLAAGARNADTRYANACTWALGQVGTRQAADVLTALLQNRADATLWDACLRCADRLTDDHQGHATAVLELLWSGDVPPRIRGAALRGLTALGAADTEQRILAALGDNEPRLAGPAAALLPALLKRGRTSAVLKQLGNASDDTQARTLLLLAENDIGAVAPFAAARLESPDALVRQAASQALARVGWGEHVAPLCRLVGASRGAARGEALTCLTQVSGEDVDTAFHAAIRRGPAAARAAAIEAAALRRLPGLTRTLTDVWDDPDATVRRAAYRTLSKQPDAALYPGLLARIPEERDARSTEALAAAAAASAARVRNDRDRLGPLEACWRNADPQAKATGVLHVLARLGGEDGLGLAREALEHEDATVQREAVKAMAGWSDGAAAGDLATLADGDDRVLAILAARGLMRQIDRNLLPVAQQLDIVTTLAENAPEDSMKDWAATKADSIRKRGHADLALEYLPYRSRERRDELAAAAEDGWRLVAYQDCGPDPARGGPGEPAFRCTRGQAYVWQAASADAVRGRTILFAGGRVEFQLGPLDPAKSYRLGLTWWDYDANGRVQRVTAAGHTLVNATRLPNHKDAKQPPQSLVVDLPGKAYSDGKTTVTVHQVGPTNAVVSELWLYESDRAPTVGVLPPRAPDARRVLLITGEDYKGHRWQETTPVLRNALLEDPRLDVDVLDDLTKLAARDLGPYATVVVHFKNYNPAVPGRVAFDRLCDFVAGGGGMVLVHFAGGAFQEFKDDFAPLAGRVWNPKLRGHDPFGPFMVEIRDRDHPITRGIDDFTTTDELYTCLEGEAEIELLATARSKVDGKNYPMIFTLAYGDGRVMHCPLGHDPAAIANPPVAEIFRRGTAWSAGLPAIPAPAGEQDQ